MPFACLLSMRRAFLWGSAFSFVYSSALLHSFLWSSLKISFTADIRDDLIELFEKLYIDTSMIITPKQSYFNIQSRVFVRKTTKSAIVRKFRPVLSRIMGRNTDELTFQRIWIIIRTPVYNYFGRLDSMKR